MLFEFFLILLITTFVLYKTLTISKKPEIVKKKKYYTKPNELGVYYEQDENGKITKFEDGQNY